MKLSIIVPKANSNKLWTIFLKDLKNEDYCDVCVNQAENVSTSGFVRIKATSKEILRNPN